LNNPLLGSHYKGAEAVLLHVAAGSEFSLNNCHEVLSALKYDLSDDVNLIWGLRTDDSMGASVKVVMLVSAIPQDELNIKDLTEKPTSSLGKSIQMIN
jgi:cell division protein FtsZ